MNQFPTLEVVEFAQLRCRMAAGQLIRGAICKKTLDGPSLSTASQHACATTHHCLMLVVASAVLSKHLVPHCAVPVGQEADLQTSPSAAQICPAVHCAPTVASLTQHWRFGSIHLPAHSL